jgi:hypothetical protein
MAAALEAEARDGPALAREASCFVLVLVLVLLLVLGGRDATRTRDEGDEAKRAVQHGGVEG